MQYKKVKLENEVKLSIEDILNHYNLTEEKMVSLSDTKEELYNLFLDKMLTMVGEQYDDTTPVICPSFAEIRVWCSTAMAKKDPLQVFIKVYNIKSKLKKWIQLKKKLIENPKNYKAAEHLEDTENILLELIEDKIYNLTYLRSRFEMNGEERIWLEDTFEDIDNLPKDGAFIDDEDVEEYKKIKELAPKEITWDNVSNFNVSNMYNKNDILKKLLDKVSKKYLTA